MPTKTLLVSALTDANPYVIGSAPDSLAGYTQPAGSDAARIGGVSGTKSFYLSGAVETMWLDDTILTGTTIYSRVTLPPIVGGASAGVVIGDINGTGHEVIFGATAGNFRVFATLNGKLSGSVLSGGTYAVAPVGNAVIELSHTGTTLTLKQNGTTLGSVTGITRPTNPRAGFSSRGGYLVALQSEYASSFTLDTLTDPLVAGAAFSGTSTGFSNGVATISSNGISAAVTIASGAFSGAWPQAVDAQPYPTLPKTAQTITLTQGANTATITSDLEQAAGQFIVNFVSPVIDDDTYPAYYIDQNGFTASGGQFVGIPYGDLVMDADSGVTVTGEGDLVGYFIPATGTGAGNAYYYTFHIIDGSVVSADRGITAVGLTMSGITARGITAVGL